MAFSFFMRDRPNLEHAVAHMIPYATGRRRIKVWDAGCALGQETYTLAIIMAERMNRFGFQNVWIDATDHDSVNRFGELVTAATYSQEELRRTPAELLAKYFEPAEQAGRYRVRAELRNRVRFHYHDLRSLSPEGNDYCLVVCKNVLLHLQPWERVEVFRMFHAALAPGGYLVTENTQRLPHEVAGLFDQMVPDAKLYKKRKTEDMGGNRSEAYGGNA